MKRLSRWMVLMSLCLTSSLSVAAEESRPAQEFYELRVYHIDSAANRSVVSTYLEQALVPALNRMGLNRIGVFTVLEPADDHSIIVLIPYPSLEALADRNDLLAADMAYQRAAQPYFARPKDDPPYPRIESKLMRAFAGMPVIELPSQTQRGEPRIFELRTYESHNEEMAARKVEMFNNGEIQVMRDVDLAPVFYGETLTGRAAPNLSYMTSAGDRASHDEHWAGFRAHPEWNRMKVLERYKGSVSKITKWFLAPTQYSQI